MKAEIHPELFECKVSCSGCGTEFTTFSTRSEIRVEVCSQCHPFFTGKQARIVDTEGRVEKFIKKFEGKEVRVSKRKRKQAVAEEERVALLEREAHMAAEKAAEEKALREEARKKRVEERAARQAAQAQKEESPEAEAVSTAEDVSPDASLAPEAGGEAEAVSVAEDASPDPEPERNEVFPHTDREKLEEFIRRPENIDLMKKASDEGRPAVDPLGHKLSKEFGVSDKDDDPKRWDNTRRWIGSIVKGVMERIGYEVDRTRGRNGNVPISGNPVFSSGSCYKQKEKSPLADATAAVAEDASPDASTAPEPGGEADTVHPEVYEKLKEVAKSGGIIHYGDVALLAGLDMGNPGDRGKLGEILGAISMREHEAGRPLLSAVSVGARDNKPSAGFFNLAMELGRLQAGDDEEAFFAEELKKVYAAWS